MESANPDNLSIIMSILRVDRLFALGMGIAIIIILAKSVQKVSDKLQHSYPSRRVLFLQIATMINFALYIGGISLLIYAVLKPPKEVLLAVGGSAAVAIGISLKDIVASVVAGVVLLFDRPFQVGDRVRFGDTYGEIVGIGLRAVKLVTLDDNLVTIPNSRFLTDVVASGNAGALDMMVVIDFHIAPNTNLELARNIVKEVVATSRFVFLKKPMTVLTSEVAIAERLAIRLRAKAYVLDCRFEKAFESDVVGRVANIFNEKNIKRPSRNDLD
ncbi:MAG: mechanosensitive ion channel [Bdellovibrionota bacterium]